MKIRRQELIAALVGVAAAIGSTQLFAESPRGGPYGPGYAMGPGMMYGYGPGYGMGPGAMWGGGCAYGSGPALNLSDQQRSNIGKIRDDLWGKQRALVGKMHEEYAARAIAKDDATAQKAYDAITQLRQQMFDNMQAARKEMDGTLTNEQREQLRGWGY